MPDYRRLFRAGGTFFFTVVTHNRRGFLCEPLARHCLRSAIEKVRLERPFEMLAFVLLPEHFHCVWRLPEGDENYSTRMACIKKDFTKAWLAGGGDEIDISRSRRERRERGVWQRRYWEHAIRDQDDLCRHVNYIHYNPVKHDVAECPHLWPYSTFHRWAEEGYYAKDWLCGCGGGRGEPPDFEDMSGAVGE